MTDKPMTAEEALAVLAFATDEPGCVAALDVLQSLVDAAGDVRKTSGSHATPQQRIDAHGDLYAALDGVERERGGL